MSEAPRVFSLMRLNTRTGKVDLIAQQAGFQHDWVHLWHWIGRRNGVAHPHPYLSYWVQAMDAPARRGNEDHIVRGEN